MWSDRSSVVLSQACVIAFAAILLLVMIFAPALVSWLLDFSRADLRGTEAYFFVTIYSGSMPAILLLYSLFGLLRGLAAEEVFRQKNVEHLRRISWSCFGGSVICLLSTFYYLPWLAVAVAAGFMGLIVRVLKNVVERAVALQDEVDCTV